MSKDLHGYTAAELIEAAAGEGHAITKNQLRDWVASGLLPRPRRIGLGRGRGTKGLYPAETIDQLRALLLARAQNRRHDHIRSYLWWSGFSVDQVRIRQEHERIAAHLARLVSRVRAAESLESDEDFWFEVEKALPRTASDSLSRHLNSGRRRVKDGDPNPLIMVIKMIAGIPIDAADPMRERAREVLTLPGFDLDDLDESEPPFFAYLPEIVDQTSDEEFCAARDELRELMRLASLVVERIGEQLHPLAAQVALSYRGNFDPFICDLCVIVWSAFREVEFGREQFARAHTWLQMTSALTAPTETSSEEGIDARHSR